MTNFNTKKMWVTASTNEEDVLDEANHGEMALYKFAQALKKKKPDIAMWWPEFPEVNELAAWNCLMSKEFNLSKPDRYGLEILFTTAKSHQVNKDGTRWIPTDGSGGLSFEVRETSSGTSAGFVAISFGTPS